MWKSDLSYLSKETSLKREEVEDFSLDSDQIRVVEDSRDVICIAGPGSGKTRVLASKAESLVKSGKDAICLTFTRTAAQEIRDRVPGVNAGTIHALCHSVVGWDDTHDDLLTRYVKQGKDTFEWVLIDEVQDLTTLQLEVVFSLVGDHLFAVGDPFQSIYGYGGAVGGEIVDILLSRGCKELTLRNNYRSSPGIVTQLNYIYPRGLKSEGLNDNGLTAILCRSNAAVSAAGEALKRARIGHKVRYGSNEYSEKKELFRGSSQIQISTVHASKGLEFKNVLLFGWDYDPKDSSRYGQKHSARLDENLNVYYVAISRAAVSFIEVLSSEDLLISLNELIPDIKMLRYREE